MDFVSQQKENKRCTSQVTNLTLLPDLQAVDSELASLLFTMELPLTKLERLWISMVNSMKFIPLPLLPRIQQRLEEAVAAATEEILRQHHQEEEELASLVMPRVKWKAKARC